MERYQDWTRLPNGAPAPSALVTVYDNGTLLQPALFADAQGVTPKPNPFTADPNGYYFFYAPQGDYDIQISGSGVTTYVLADVTIGVGSDGNSVSQSVMRVGFFKALGGSRSIGLAGPGSIDVESYIDIAINWPAIPGVLTRLHASIRTSDEATSVAAVLRNITDGADVVISPPSASMSWVDIAPLPILGESGFKTYRLQAVKTNGEAEVYVLGYLLQSGL